TRHVPLRPHAGGPRRRRSIRDGPGRRTRRRGPRGPPRSTVLGATDPRRPVPGQDPGRLRVAVRRSRWGPPPGARRVRGAGARRGAARAGGADGGPRPRRGEVMRLCRALPVVFALAVHSAWAENPEAPILG